MPPKEEQLIDYAQDPPDCGHDTEVSNGDGEGVDKSWEIQEIVKSNQVKIEDK